MGNIAMHSKYEGVNKQTQILKNAEKLIRWIARVMVDGKHLYLGTFPNQDDAARCVNHFCTDELLTEPLNPVIGENVQERYHKKRKTEYKNVHFHKGAKK